MCAFHGVLAENAHVLGEVRRIVAESLWQVPPVHEGRGAVLRGLRGDGKSRGTGVSGADGKGGSFGGGMEVGGGVAVGEWVRPDGIPCERTCLEQAMGCLGKVRRSTLQPLIHLPRRSVLACKYDRIDIIHSALADACELARGAWESTGAYTASTAWCQTHPLAACHVCCALDVVCASLRHRACCLH